MDAAERGGENRVVHDAALHQGVGEQSIDGDPQQYVHRHRRRTDADFRGTDQARNDERRCEGEHRRYRRFEAGPEHVGGMAGLHLLKAGSATVRSEAMPSTAISGGSHMMRHW